MNFLIIRLIAIKVLRNHKTKDFLNDFNNFQKDHITNIIDKHIAFFSKYFKKGYRTFLWSALFGYQIKCAFLETHNIIIFNIINIAFVSFSTLKIILFFIFAIGIFVCKYLRCFVPKPYSNTVYKEKPPCTVVFVLLVPVIGLEPI